jgi:hypothetical protein
MQLETAQEPDLATEAFGRLFPGERPPWRAAEVAYGRYRGYRAAIRLAGGRLTVGMAKAWRDVSREIQIGLIQDLLVRLLKRRKHTANMDLYAAYMKRVPATIPKTRRDPVLEASYRRVNDRYFLGQVEQPNLKYHGSLWELGRYEYGTDTVSISRILLEDQELLDYVMYHELLHKVHAFTCKGGRHLHHSHKFRKAESIFRNAAELERRLERLVASHRGRRRRLFAW